VEKGNQIYPAFIQSCFITRSGQNYKLHVPIFINQSDRVKRRLIKNLIVNMGRNNIGDTQKIKRQSNDLCYLNCLVCHLSV
jgi:hypothetical protein